MGRAFRADVHQTLDHQEGKTNHQSGILIENLLNGYDRITKEIGRELDGGLSFPSMLRRSVMGIFSKQGSIKDWLNDLTKKLETHLNAELRSKLSDGVVDKVEKIPGRLPVGVFGLEHENDQVAGRDKPFSDILVAFDDGVGAGRIHNSDIAQDIDR